MDTARLQSVGSRMARLLTGIACLTALCLISAFLAFNWMLFGSGADFPPTWYWAATILLTVVDVAAMCYIAIRVARVLITRKSGPTQLIRAAFVLVLILGTFHAMTLYGYAKTPVWDYQDSLFDDLSRPGPGTISPDCRAATKPSPILGAEQPTSPEEIERIARIEDWQTRYNELENRTAVGWRGWIQDVSRHGYYSNPEHRLITVSLHDPYSNPSGAGVSQGSEAVLSYFDPHDVGKLAVGQEVLVCGQIYYTSADDSNIQISISKPVINPLPLPETLTTTQIPADFLVEYEVHGCGGGYACAEYNLRIDAEGNVTYRGFANVATTGTRTTRIANDKLKQLAFELQRTKLLAVNGFPETTESDPQGATVIRARMEGRNKTIVLPWRGGEWTLGVIMVIGKIEEVSNLQQWVKLVKE